MPERPLDACGVSDHALALAQAAEHMLLLDTIAPYQRRLLKHSVSVSRTIPEHVRSACEEDVSLMFG
jgi:hypothetical protein